MEVARLTTARDADDNVTGTFTQERPDKGECVAEPLPGFAIARRTVHRMGGEVVQTWEQEKPGVVERLADIDRILDARIKRINEIEPRAPVVAPRVAGPAEYLNQVTIADGHVGAMAWAVETGSHNWNLGIARDTILSGACWLMDNLPPASDLLLVILGDFLDTDGYAPLTPASKHLLDVDGRFPKIADVGCDVIEEAVVHGLKSYNNVRLVIKPGNHDPLSAYWMRKLFTRIFKHEPRVAVEQSIRPYWAMTFGKCMIATHHGDKASLNDLPSIFAADFAEIWGTATYRICHTGHLHHKDIRVNTGKDLRGMTVYQHPTVSSRNAWAAERGYPGDRELLGHSYHRAGRMVTTLHFDPDMLELAA